MGTNVTFDAYGHETPSPAPTLPCIALANAPSTTVGIGPLAASGTGGAGAGATTAYVGGTSTGATAVDTLNTSPDDVAGTFVLAAAGTPVAGLIAQVNFKQAYGTPVTVLATCVDVTASPNVAVPVGVVLNATAPGTTAGFQIASAGTALTTAHNYQIAYIVQP